MEKVLGVEWEGMGRNRSRLLRRGAFSRGPRGCPGSCGWKQAGGGMSRGEGGLGLDEFCLRNAGGLRVPGSGFLKVSSSGTLGFSPGLPGPQKPGVEFPHGPLPGSVRARPTRSTVGLQRSSLITACLKCVLLRSLFRERTDLAC